jgi:hypothetical protein
MLVRTEKIDPNDYPFKKFIDQQKHLDTDELRHTIKPIRHKIDEDCKTEEHKYCDKEQLDGSGKWRRPKIMIEAERRGFKSVSDMVEADKKAEEDKKVKEVSDLREFTTKQNDVIKKLIDKQETLEQTIVSQNNLLQEIINRLKK